MNFLKTLLAFFVMALGLIANAEARYFDPVEGIFISKDPAGFKGGDANLYRYVGGNPINRVDPFGLRWIYQQSTGNIYYEPHPGWPRVLVETGYAGNGAGLNNPSMQDVPNTGPLPQGNYTIEPQQNNITGRGRVLPDSMRLTPDPNNEMFGRDGFLIHGGNMTKRTSSQGCIVTPIGGRNTIGNNTDRNLTVEP